MAVTCVCYEVEGWGLAELCVDDARVLWHELPRPHRQHPHPGWGAVPPPTAASVPRHGGRNGNGSAPILAAAVPSLGAAAPQLAATVAELRAAPSGADGVVADLIARFRAFFRGDRVEFSDVHVDLDDLTPFHRSCAQVMRAVPRGDVVTYGELAALAGAPGAARAAGSFCARNRLSVIVPCHRVVAAGTIGGYGSLGAEYKRRMLALEGVAL